MDIAFKTKKLKKIFDSQKDLRRKYGAPMAEKIMVRLAVLQNAVALSLVPKTRPERMHQLKGNRDEQYAVDLVQPARLVFEPNHESVPRMEDGGIDLEQVTAITILEIIDYHPKSS